MNKRLDKSMSNYSCSTLFIFKISAKKLGVIAVAAWLISLVTTVFVLYSNEHRIIGVEILVLGWLSPIVLNVAWYANIPFLYAIYVLLFTDKLPIMSAIISVLLALDTFRFKSFLTGSGSLDPIYGYGWGAVLWFLSIYLMLAAVGIRRREANTLVQKQLYRELLYPLGITLALLTVCTAAYFALHDRMLANTAESKRLVNVAFKLGKSCGSSEPHVTNPIRNLSGPVEIVMVNNLRNASYPFVSIETLLQWGIPTIRIGGDDYSYESTAHYGLFSSVPAVGAPTAVLYVSETDSGNIHAKLVEFRTNRTVFEQVWVREKLPVDVDKYCPDYNSFPSLDQQPRKVFMQGLGLYGAKSKSSTITPEEGEYEKIDGTITRQGRGGVTTTMRTEQWRNLRPENKDSVPPWEFFNINCPSNVGWSSHKNDSSLNTGRPFMVNEKAYYLKYLQEHNATCEGDYAYIYSGRAERGKCYLAFQERDLRDFQKMKAVTVAFANPKHHSRDGVLKLQAIKKAGKVINMEIVNDNSGDVYFVQATMKK